MQLAKAWMTRWVIGTVIGWLVGYAIGYFTSPLFSPIFNLLSINQLYFQVFLIGINLGLVQWLIALRKNINGIAWTASIGIASVIVVVSLEFAASHQLIPSVFEYVNPGCLSADCDTFILRDTWLAGTLMFSLVGSLTFAIPTTIVLFRYSSRPYLWVLGCILAGLSGVLLYVLLTVPFPLSFGYFVALCYIGIIGPSVIALVSAPFLYRTLLLFPRAQQ